MNYLLEMLGKGLEMSPAELLAEYLTHPKRSKSNLPINRGLDLLRVGKPRAAARCLAPLCQNGPHRAFAHVASAVACDEESNPRGAMSHLRSAIEIRPGRADILSAMGLCCEKAHRRQQAVKYYLQAIHNDPAGAPARYRLAAVGISTEQWDAAIKQCMALTHFELRHNWLIGAMGMLNYRAGQYDRAVDLFQAAIAMEPENWALSDQDTEELVSQGKIYQAMERLGELLQRQGPFADIHTRLGDLYGQIGDDEHATKHYLMALDIQPDYLETTVKLASHHLVFGRIEQAAETFHRAAELNNRVMYNYAALGCAHMRLGQKTQAHNAFELVAAVEPNTVMLISESMRLQLLLVETGPTGDEAQQALIRAHDNDHLLLSQVRRLTGELARSDRADIRYSQGILMMALGQVDQAEKHFARAAQINPAHTPSIVELAIIRHKKGLNDRAVETFLKATDTPQEILGRHYRMALLYADRRRFARATRSLAQRLGERWPQQRSAISTSLEQMGLLDAVSSAWRNLQKIHQKNIKKN